MKKNEMFKNIVAIRTAKNNVIHSGTGFFVKANEGKIYLVTATHVARDTTTNTDIWLRNLTTGFPFAFKISQLNSMAMWLYHPVADIAILEVTSKIYQSPYISSVCTNQRLNPKPLVFLISTHPIIFLFLYCGVYTPSRLPYPEPCIYEKP